MVAALVGLEEVSGTKFIWHNQFGGVIAVPYHQHGGTRFQKKLLEVMFEERSSVITRIKMWFTGVG